MTSIPATPAFTVPLPKHKRKSKILFCKKGDELKHMRNILGSMSGIKLGHLKYYDRQPVNAQIYPNKLHERNRQENPTNSDTEAYDYEYIDDICAFYQSKEKSMKLGGFGKKSRARIVEWLIEAHNTFEFPTEALYLAIDLFDRFLAVHPVEKKKEILVGVTALRLAAKNAGTRESIPCVGSFSQLMLTSWPVKGTSCSVDQILEMEALILRNLEFDSSISALSAFMWKFLHETQSNDKIKHLSFFFIDLCLVQRETHKFRPSMLTAAAIYTAHATVKRRMPCSKIYEQLTGCSAPEILECSKLMVTSHKKARSVKSVYKKYNTRRYSWAARAEPAHFLLMTKFGRACFIISKLILFLLKDC